VWTQPSVLLHAIEDERNLHQNREKRVAYLSVSDRIFRLVNNIVMAAPLSGCDRNHTKMPKLSTEKG